MDRNKYNDGWMDIKMDGWRENKRSMVGWINN